MIVAIEGGDACGKNTLRQGLVLFAEKTKMFGAVHSYSFPRYDAPVGRIIKAWLQDGRAGQDPIAFQALMCADRYAAASEILDLADDPTNLIVLDRWWQSGCVYTRALLEAQGRSPAEIDTTVELVDRMSLLLPNAQLNVLLDLPAEVAVVRRPERRDVFEQNNVLRQNVARLYREFWQTHREIGDPETEWHVVDAQQGIGEVLMTVAKLVITSPFQQFVESTQESMRQELLRSCRLRLDLK